MRFYAISLISFLIVISSGIAFCKNQTNIIFSKTLDNGAISRIEFSSCPTEDSRKCTKLNLFIDNMNITTKEELWGKVFYDDPESIIVYDIEIIKEKKYNDKNAIIRIAILYGVHEMNIDIISIYEEGNADVRSISFANRLDGSLPVKGNIVFSRQVDLYVTLISKSNLAEIWRENLYEMWLIYPVDLVQKWYESANAKITKMIEKAPKNADLYISRAKNFIHLGKYDRSFEDANMALKISPSNNDYTSFNSYLSSIIRAKENDNKKRSKYINDRRMNLKDLDLKIANDSKNPRWYYYKALAFKDLNEIEKAVENFKLAISHADNKNVDIYKMAMENMMIKCSELKYNSLFPK